jgi:hypothetical protein
MIVKIEGDFSKIPALSTTKVLWTMQVNSVTESDNGVLHYWLKPFQEHEMFTLFQGVNGWFLHLVKDGEIAIAHVDVEFNASFPVPGDV